MRGPQGAIATDPETLRTPPVVGASVITVFDLSYVDGDVTGGDVIAPLDVYGCLGHDVVMARHGCGPAPRARRELVVLPVQQFGVLAL